MGKILVEPSLLKKGACKALLFYKVKFCFTVLLITLYSRQNGLLGFEITTQVYCLLVCGELVKQG